MSVPGGPIAVGARDAADPLPGDLDLPRDRRHVREPIGMDVRDQVAERVLEDHLADEPELVG